MSRPNLASRLPPREHASEELLLSTFLDHVAGAGLELYPAQEEAVLALLAGQNVVLATPTGSGKSLVALALHMRSLALGERSFYTAPIKALVGEKFFALCRELGAENVGLMTGDATVNRDAKIICCTAEILANLALREGARADVGSVVMDEVHYYGDSERGMAWQVPMLLLERAQFLLMSATLGDVSLFENDLRERTGRETVTVRSASRPVPLEFEYKETPLHETLGELILLKRAPVYVVHFTQRGAVEHAQDLMSTELVDKDRKAAIKEATRTFRWDSPFGKDLGRYVRHGVGVHHAGLLPKYRLLIERLAQEGLLAVICGTDTLGVGVNVPIRSVLFTQLCKYDGKKTAVLSVRDFQQIAGRAGRKGFDDRGWVVAQAPEHVVENRIARMKAEGDAKKQKKLVAKKPPERGYAHWDEETFKRLASGEPEKLESRFRISHGAILTLLEGAEERRENGCRAIDALIRRSHESRPRKFHHARHAIALFRSLMEAEVIEKGPYGMRIAGDLQRDFSLNQTLSLFVIDAVQKLDKEDPAYALDLLTLAEATLEDPDVVLMKQVDALKGERVRELKAEGVEYDQRMEELEKVEPPRPRADDLARWLDEFAEKHPWVGRAELRPKSVARDMWEKALGFHAYVKELGLARSEGVLLRYLSDAYKALAQSVPDFAKTDEVDELTTWLRGVVRGVDSSLLDEWERLANPEAALRREEAREEEQPDVTRDRRAFAVMVRQSAFRVVALLARRRYADAAELVVAPEGSDRWTPERLAESMQVFHDEHGALRTDAEARAPKQTRIEEDGELWSVEQTLLDEADTREAFLVLRVDLARAREAGEPVLELVELRVG